MKFPMESTFIIKTYRDFYDVPRKILARDDEAGYWVFDCAFDDELDDYRDSYEIHFVGRNLAEAEEEFRQCCQGLSGVASLKLPVSRLDFDSTKRSSFTIMEHVHDT